MDKEAYQDLTGYELSESRNDWKSLCPIHSESTASFYIHKDSYLCHCFGCGAAGYVENVLARAYNIKPSAVRSLLGIPLLRDLRFEGGVREELPTFELAWLAAYKKIRSHPFLERRGFTPETIIYHDARWDPAGRIVFPIRTLGSEPIGAVGRAVNIPSIPMKWWYYWPVSKDNILYSQTLDGIIDANYTMILVEGIFDVMWLNQYGYHNAAAPIAASCTKKQLERIKTVAESVVLFLDNDEAGRKGQDKIEKSLKSSVKVSYASYPEGKNDPQELTEQELHTALGHTLTHVEYINTNRT